MQDDITDVPCRATGNHFIAIAVVMPLMLLLAVFMPVSTLSQPVDSWKVYPSFSTVNDLSMDEDGTLTAATLGGIFIKAPDKEDFTTFTPINGMHRSDASALVHHSNSEVIYAGYMDGMIDRIDVQNGSIDQIRDIYRVSRFNTKSITGMLIHEAKLYVSTAFGIVIYNLNTLLVENSVIRIGGFNAGMGVNNIRIRDNRIYAALDGGVAMASLDDNIVDSSAWTSYHTADGLPDNAITDFTMFNEVLYAASADGVYRMGTDGSWQAYSNLSGVKATGFNKNHSDNDLFGYRANKVFRMDTAVNISVYTAAIKSDFTVLNQSASGKLVAGSSNEGGISFSFGDDDLNHILPDGPYLNFFSDLEADGTKIIAASTGDFPQADPLNPVRGYYIFKDGAWENYNRNTSAELASENFSTGYKVEATSGYYFIGSWGHGVAVQDKSDNTISVHNTSTSDLSGWRDGINYIVVSGIKEDRNGDVWLITSDSEFSLNLFDEANNNWIPFREEFVPGTYFNLFVDSNNQKWISLIDNLNSGSGTGLMVLDTGNPEDAGDDRFQVLNTSENTGNLPNNKVNAITEDKNGEVWIGTGRGIARFIFPDLIIGGGPNEWRAQWLINEDTTAASRFLLRDVEVTAIAVNAANQKWVGSSNLGVWLLNDEGSRIEEHFTAENSPLLSNAINDIEIIESTGEVLISTDQGLVSYFDEPRAAVDEMDELKVYPNPFSYKKHDRIFTEGLSAVSRIKILTADGLVVNEIDAAGGRVAWDARDFRGNKLGSGVYFIVAYEEDSNGKGLGKVVIINGE